MPLLESLKVKGAAYFVKLNKILNFVHNSAMVHCYSKEWIVSSEEKRVLRNSCFFEDNGPFLSSLRRLFGT
jgi:hypothetical protein